MIPIGPYQKEQAAKKIHDKIRFYRLLYIPILLAAIAIVGFFLYGNYHLYHIQGEYYVYHHQKFKLSDPENIDIENINNDTIRRRLTDSIIIPVPPIHRIDTNRPKPLVIPSYVDLRGSFSPIKNQGQQGSCLAFTMSAIMEYLHKFQKNQIYDFSEAFIYYQARKWANQQNQDNGSSITFAVYSLKEEGICIESMMPYSQYDYSTPPSASAFSNATHYRIENFSFLNTKNLDEFRAALNKNNPIAVSVCVFSSFGQGKNGLIPLPRKNELNAFYSGRSHGYHAMVIVGYDDNKEHFIVRNSWGSNFGDNGYCYLPYDYVTDSRLCNWAGVINSLKF